VSAPGIRPAVPGDRAAIRALLDQASLPVDDLDDAPVRFWVAEHGSRLTGAVGFEPYGAAALLRSLVVAPEARGQGLGSALVTTLEREARAAGIGQLVLLTQTARPLFEHLGYAVSPRETVPAAVRASAEFRHLCPASAVCMTRHLTADTRAPRNPP